MKTEKQIREQISNVYNCDESRDGSRDRGYINALEWVLGEE